MIAALTPRTALLWNRRADRTTLTGLRMCAAYACYGPDHPACRFYLTDGGALMLAGRSALYCGAVGGEEELASFLQMSGVRSFQSETLLLPGWRAVPRLVMRARTSLPRAGEPVQIDAAPDLWALAHSGLLADTDPDAFYADVCARVNKGMAAVCAVRSPDGYAAMAYAQAAAPEGVYITAVATAPAYRRRGYAAQLLCAVHERFAPRPAWVMCEPGLRRFYEKRGYRLVHPLCEYQNTDEGNRDTQP